MNKRRLSINKYINYQVCQPGCLSKLFCLSVSVCPSFSLFFWLTWLTVSPFVKLSICQWVLPFPCANQSVSQYDNERIKMWSSAFDQSLTQSIHLSVSQFFSQSLNQSMGESISQTVSQSVTQSSQSVSQSVSHSVYQSTNQPKNLLASLAVRQSTNQIIVQLVTSSWQSVSQLVSHSIS